ncbi:hypothetical protein HN615_01960 [Candidatus Woesearchaeota archaeon]|nr:hypothetical protein [Candidatus Woesearchaeota archaeon]
MSEKSVERKYNPAATPAIIDCIIMLPVPGSRYANTSTWKVIKKPKV